MCFSLFISHVQRVCLRTTKFGKITKPTGMYTECHDSSCKCDAVCAGGVIRGVGGVDRAAGTERRNDDESVYL